MSGNDLIGAMFTTAKELRHLAEQHYGELFVPTELIVEADGYALFALRVGSGRVVVRAERAERGYPFTVTRLELESDGRRIA
jgi:hypothetical protein